MKWHHGHFLKLKLTIKYSSYQHLLVIPIEQILLWAAFLYSVQSAAMSGQLLLPSWEFHSLTPVILSPSEDPPLSLNSGARCGDFTSESPKSVNVMKYFSTRNIHPSLLEQISEIVAFSFTQYKKITTFNWD